MTEVCIVGARRTPIGRFLGSLSSCSAADMAVHAATAAIEGIPQDRIDQVIVGNVLSAGQGMNVARQIGVRLGLPLSTPAFTVNMMCGSGLQAVLLGVQAITAHAADVVLCGGTESMSQAPHVFPRSRTGAKFGDTPLVDTVLKDGLLDAFNGEHMATTAERLAQRFGITRQQQDAFAALSQQRCHTATQAGLFDAETAAMPELATDEHARPETTLEQLSKLKPAFSQQGTITAGNASGINDGAAMLVLARQATAEAHGWPILAQISGATAVGCDPQEMGLGPVYAIQKLCQQHQLSLQQFDTIEINEAFAAQTLACLHELQLNAEQINHCGGAIAMGHPIGCSGARLAVHLSHRIHQNHTQSGLAALCVGGGMGVALALRSA